MRLRLPDLVSVYTENGQTILPGAERLAWEDVSLELIEQSDVLRVRCAAERAPMRYLRLRWNFADGEKRQRAARILGDEWERGYGHMEWRGIAPDRCMPWTMLVSDGSDADEDPAGRLTEGFGVRVRPAAMCFWQYDAAGITLWLDVRNGGDGVRLNGRTLDVCEVVFYEGRDMTALRAGKAFYALLCDDPLIPPRPVYGGNTWYFSYGDMSQAEVVQATRLIADLCPGLDRPYMVVDDGWAPNDTDGPWDRGGARFPDMAALAEEIRALGVRPGIWFRPLSDIGRGTAGMPDAARLMRDQSFFDPSHPATRELTRRDVERFTREWGYELIKHDFTNFDVFGYWGFQRETTMTDDGWHFYDRGRTSAEILTDYYRLIREAAGAETVLIGCNASGHLIAGMAHLNRTGDDTSGKEWERNRRYGVNTLAFRQLHDKAFFIGDADCVGIRGEVPWSLNREWLRALARSGTPLFAAVKPGVCNEQERKELREAFVYASRQTDVLEPIDWMENSCPERWRLNGAEMRFNWYPPEGTENFKP